MYTVHMKCGKCGRTTTYISDAIKKPEDRTCSFCGKDQKPRDNTVNQRSGKKKVTNAELQDTGFVRDIDAIRHRTPVQEYTGGDI